MSPHRTTREKGQEVEQVVKDMLERFGADYSRNTTFDSPYGSWDIDFFVNSNPPVLISCKNPTEEAKVPGDSIRRKSQEAWFQLSGLTRLCPAIPHDARLVLVTGALPLRTRGRDYEVLLTHLFDGRLVIARASDLNSLEKVLREAMAGPVARSTVQK